MYLTFKEWFMSDVTPANSAPGGSRTDSRTVETNQQGLHERLDDIVRKHVSGPFQKPFHDATLETFYRLKEAWQADGRPLILDSCCGVGESTVNLAEHHPDAFILGLDKSDMRIEKHDSYRRTADNYRLARVDLNDFWRLAVADGWQLMHHYILYPNPWPKATHFKRRWHGAAVFPYLLMLGGQLQMRSNFPLYLQEFQRALEVAGLDGEFSPLMMEAEDSDITPFERKYRLSGQPLFRLDADLNGFTLPWQKDLKLPSA